MTYNIVIGGEAGSGLVTSGTLLSKILANSGYYIVATQSYQSRIRGGHNSFHIRVSCDEILAPEEAIHILAALDSQTIDCHALELAPNGIIITDSLLSNNDSHIRVPYKELAPQKTLNMAVLGVISCVLGLDKTLALREIERAFHKKGDAVAAENIKAFTAGFEWTSKKPPLFEKLPQAKNETACLMMNGNDAIALGALSAGIKFYSFYPMTPSTGIGQTLAEFADDMELVVEQGEDEIAVINMAIGASFAGAPSMVGTSGGGFALMVEAVSLAAMTETPIVILIGQRPAPATGLPTRTEQADLEFVLHAGHGEFPRAIFAPSNPEECFHLTRRAFKLAHEYQGPVFILTDQFLADSKRCVKPFDIKNLPPIPTGLATSENITKPYQRYALTENGISPRLVPGLTEHLVVADSDEHTPDGHLTEDLSVRREMVEKRLKKLSWLKNEVTAPELIGTPNSDILFISWGSTRGSAIEAARHLKKDGINAAVLHFSQVWPIIPSQFMNIISAAKRVISIESNATGQFARLMRRECGIGSVTLDVKEKILRYDGLPITPEYIIRNI